MFGLVRVAYLVGDPCRRPYWKGKGFFSPEKDVIREVAWILLNKCQMQAKGEIFEEVTYVHIIS